MLSVHTIRPAVEYIMLQSMDLVNEVSASIEASNEELRRLSLEVSIHSFCPDYFLDSLIDTGRSSTTPRSYSTSSKPASFYRIGLKTEVGQ